VIRRTALLLAVIAAASSGGAAAKPPPAWPLLTFAIRDPLSSPLGYGLCATDLHGHSFRASEPSWTSGGAWSPGGGSITFSRNQDEMVVTRADGGNVRRISTVRAAHGWYSGFEWSPDGRRLALVTNESSEYAGQGSLIVVNPDATGRRLLVRSPGGTWLGGPDWSPDGNTLLYSEAGIPWDIHLPPPDSYGVDASGANRRLFLAYAAGASWSPDGRQVAYTGYEPSSFATVAGIGVADGDGTNAHLIVHGYAYGATWSPDGQHLAFVGHDGLHVVRADGSDDRLLSATDGVQGIAWSPDGSMIAFGKGYLGRSRLAVIRPDGAGERLLPTDGFVAAGPSWRASAPLPNHRRPCVLRGTAGPDLLRGTVQGDLIFGGAGTDRIYGRGGDDVLVGGFGRDVLYGGPGNDVFQAEDGDRDVLYGGPGRSDYAYMDEGLDRSHSVERRNRP
jgi:hypothetical protein